MDDNQMQFDCEPVEERPAEPKQESAASAQQPTETPKPNQTPYYYPQQPTKKPKKNRTTAKIVALIVGVALVGSIGGALLTTAISNLRKPVEEEVPPPVEEVLPPEEETLPPVEIQQEAEEPFERVEHALPEKLFTNDTGKALNPVQVYELTVNSVVGIRTEITTNIFGQEAVAASTGTGFILSEDGYILTNCHVVANANSIEVSLFNGDHFKAELVGADSDFDIAVLKIQANGLPAVSVGDSDALKVGEDVVAIGNPLGELTFTMTNGIVSALDREINTDGAPQNMLQTNAAINSGNSGGPLFDMDGNVIGVTTAKYSGSSRSGTSIEGLGFAIPINDALKVAYDLVEYGYVKGQAYLGVTVTTLSAEAASYYGLPVGPRIETIGEGSCTEKAGMVVGDIIVEFNGVAVKNNAALLAALKKVKAGDTVEVVIFRAGAEMTMQVTLDERPSEEELNQMLEDAKKSQQTEVETPQQPEGYYYQFPEGFGFES